MKCTHCGDENLTDAKFCRHCGIAFGGTDAGSLQESRVVLVRRYDFDALRALAMFLGIALHAALAFSETGWPIQDSQQNDSFGLAVSAIHGFRMPVFFLMSGFFTAMLWRNRGVRSLITHRLKRVGLPLVLAMITIVPLMNYSWFAVLVLPEIVSEIGSGSSDVDSGKSKSLDVSEENLIRPIVSGDIDKVQVLLDKGKINWKFKDDKFGVTLLSWATISGKKDMVELLIQSGADVNAKNRDGATALHAAAFLGDIEIARVLISSGAEVNAKNNDGEIVLESSRHDLDTVDYVLDALGMEDVDRSKAKAGRREVRELLKQHGVVWSDEGRSSSDVFSAYQKFLSSEVMGFLIYSNVFHHLWFLWFLIWLFAGFTLYAKFIDSMGWKRVLPKWLLFPPVNLLLLTLVTVAPQLLMGEGGAKPVFGPDTNTGILPLPHLLAYYALFFGYGALYFDSDDKSGTVSRFWWLILPVGLFLLFPLGYELSVGGFGFVDSFTDSNLHRPISILAQSAYPWFMAFGLMGMFRKFMGRKSYAIRYLSDSAYWLYLTHLPIIIIGQGIVRDWQIPAMVKFTIICAVTIGILLLIYQFTVRYTRLGTILNGARARPKEIDL